MSEQTDFWDMNNVKTRREKIHKKKKKKKGICLYFLLVACRRKICAVLADVFHVFHCLHVDKSRGIQLI